MLHSKDHNSLFISDPLKTPTKEQTAVSNKETEKSQTTMRLRKVQQPITAFSRTKIYQHWQIRLKLYKISSFVKFHISEMKRKTGSNVIQLIITHVTQLMLDVIK